MNEGWIAAAASWRLAALALTFALVAAWELLEPWRVVAAYRARRNPLSRSGVVEHDRVVVLET